MDAPMLMMWGDNTYGQLGDNTTIKRSSPVQTVTFGANWKQVACGWRTTAAIKADGTLWTWGQNYAGLGDNTTNSYSSPVQTVAFGTNWKQVACGRYHTAAIKTDGTLWCWGDNNFGGLGDNTGDRRSSPVQTITYAKNWKQVACGWYHTAAIKTDGTLWIWGRNYIGELGDNTTIDRSSPVQTVAGGTNWKQAACGWTHTAAIKTDGTLWIWGLNNYGQLGYNTATNKSSPTQTVAGGTNWKQVACGNYHTAAIKTDGTLWCWGWNNGLGDNTAVNKSSPVQTVAGGTNWKQVSAGSDHTACIKTDGTLWSWGFYFYGQLGDNTSNTRSSPVQTVLYGNNWKQVACGSNHTAAIKDGDF
jgi:alpha-tubulin suppressor-like RCC1 family protein